MARCRLDAWCLASRKASRPAAELRDCLDGASASAWTWSLPMRSICLPRSTTCSCHLFFPRENWNLRNCFWISRLFRVAAPVGSSYVIERAR